MKKDDVIESRQVKIDALYKQQHRVIVGIDLTGSAKRPSGFCVMQNAYAITCRVKEDEEILTLIDKYNPDLISLDCLYPYPLAEYLRLMMIPADINTVSTGRVKGCFGREESEAILP